MLISTENIATNKVKEMLQGVLIWLGQKTIERQIQPIMAYKRSSLDTNLLNTLTKLIVIDVLTRHYV